MATNVQYRVARGRTVLLDKAPAGSGSPLLKEGSILTREMIDANKITDKWLADQHRDGFVEPVTQTQFVSHPNSEPNHPGALPTLDGNARVAISDPGRAPGQSTPGGLSQTVTPFSPPPQPGGLSIWNLDPATLHGKDLGQLNVMVLERDPSVPPFNTIQEAISFLCRDFRARQ